jgi:cullin 3
VHQSETTNVYDLGLILFKDEILHHQLVTEHLRNTLLAMVAQERRGEIVDRCVSSLSPWATHAG